MPPEIKALLTDIQAVLVKHNAYIDADADALDTSNMITWLSVGINGDKDTQWYHELNSISSMDSRELDKVLK